MIDFISRRTVLYMPGSNIRAMEKAKSLPADSFIIDLEDAVSPREKDKAREQVCEAVNAGAFHDGGREVAVRINALSSAWGMADLQAVMKTSINAIALPKVESASQIHDVANVINGKDTISIWAMIETPRGVLNAEEIASAHPKLKVLVMGTSDLANDLRVPHTADRVGLLYALSKCVTVARANGLNIIDGVHLDLADDKGFLLACEQARNLGFDGKSLIHPKQISTANRIFSPTKSAIEHAREVIEAWKEAEKKNSGVVVVNGKLVENLHVVEAKRILAVMKVIENRTAL